MRGAVKQAVAYKQTGRSSIAPERLLHALLMMVFYSIRSERQLMKQLNYNLLFRSKRRKIAAKAKCGRK
jgi:transposase